ncbi:MAG TPA: hypothetical protein VLX68_00055 [Chitinivibrionales bacterium]|nr:hypothetical protein [Chitinivibrionales bacterium]
MGREVSVTQPYVDKLVKLIPTEILGAYTVIAGVVPADQVKVVLTASAAALLMLVPLYLWKISGVKNVAQLVVSAFSFVIWTYTLGGPFEAWGIYQGYIGSILLVLFTLIVPIVVRPADVDTVQG